MILTFGLVYSFDEGFKTSIIDWIANINKGSAWGWFLLGLVIVLFQLLGLPVTLVEITYG